MNEYVLEKTNWTGNKIAQLKKEKKIEIKVKILYEVKYYMNFIMKEASLVLIVMVRITSL